MDTFTISAVDPDNLEWERGTVATVHGTRGEALARGCEAVLDGWIDVRVEGTFQGWNLTDEHGRRYA